MDLTAAIVVAALVLSALAFVLIRNAIIAARNRVDEAWSGIDVQLKRRRDLIPNLAEVEDEIQASRRIYNANARAYNTRIQIFPNSIVAGFGGFRAREYFEIE